MTQLETGQEFIDSASQVEHDLSSSVESPSKITFDVKSMFGKHEGEEQDGGNEKTENLDDDYLDSKFRALYNDISQNQETDLLEVYNYDGIKYEISLDHFSVNYDAQKHSCKVDFYNRRKSEHLRGPIFVTATLDVTDKETFDRIESNIRESLVSRDFTKIDELEGFLSGLVTTDNNLNNNDKWDNASKIVDSFKK